MLIAAAWLAERNTADRKPAQSGAQEIEAIKPPLLVAARSEELLNKSQADQLRTPGSIIQGHSN